MRHAVCPSTLFLLGLLCCFGYAAGNEAKPPPGKLLRLKVRVVDTLGSPIARARIEFWQSGGEGRAWWTARRIAVNDGKAVHTGEDGWAAASFSLVPNPATYRGPRVGFCLTAQAKDFLVTRSGRVDPWSSDHFEVMLTLRRLVGVEGHVVDQQGRPVADATVFHTGNATPRTAVKTDAHGHFRVEGLPEGKSPLFVTHPAYHFHGQLVDASAKSPERELKLLAAGQTAAPLRTLPPVRSHAEELKTARQIIRPLWTAAMKTAGDGEKEWCCESYAHLDPWDAYDYVNANLSMASKNRFVSWKLPLLYATEPDEALAVLESLDTLEYMKGFALLRTVRSAPGSNPQQLDLLDRATQHLRAATEPDERVFRLSSAAVWLFKLGKAAEAKKIVELVAPLAKQLSPKTDAAARATAGEAISIFDQSAGVRLIFATCDEGDDYYWMPALFHVTYRIAKQQPAEAERIAAETLRCGRRLCPKFYQQQYNRNPTEEELAVSITSHENRLVPLCYHLASVDAARAQRMAASIQNPYVRAYAVGMVAKALAPSGRAKARKLILQAYDTLAETGRNPDRRWAQLSFVGSPATVAAGLLPVVEEIDPTLVDECMWRAVSLRLHRSTDELLTALEPETNDATLAAFVARYNRPLARALLPSVDEKVVPARNAFDFCWLPGLVMIDINEAMERLRADASRQGADASQCFQTAFFLIHLLPVDAPHRWDYVASQHSLWIPDNQYIDESSYSW
jgi:hypothetical protein